LGLALVTSLLWGVLPIILKALLLAMDPNTITWYRFLVAALVLGAHLSRRGRLPALRGVGKRAWILLSAAAICLSANYVLYLVGLESVSPEAAQMVIQLAPMFLLLGGLLIFKEPFVKTQWIGLALLLTGLVLFFNHRIDELSNSSGSYYLGVLTIVLAGLLWAVYALAQKGLLAHFSSEQILLLIYVGSILIIFPLTRPVLIFNLDLSQIGLLAFCCLNTLLAYGAFAEALVHWEASRVSAVISITPLITLVAMELIDRFLHGLIAVEDLNTLSLIGSGLIVFGSMLAALGKRRRKIALEAEATAVPE